MNKHIKLYQEALARINKGMERNTIALEDIECVFESLGGYIEFLEKKIARLESKDKTKPSAKSKVAKPAKRKS